MRIALVVFLTSLLAVSGCGSDDPDPPPSSSGTTGAAASSGDIGFVDMTFEQIWRIKSNSQQEEVVSKRPLAVKERVLTSDVGYGDFELTDITACEVQNETDVDILEPDPDDSSSLAFRVNKGKVQCGHDALNQTEFTFQAGDVTVETLGTIVLVDVSDDLVYVSVLAGSTSVTAAGVTTVLEEGNRLPVLAEQAPGEAMALVSADLSPLDLSTAVALAQTFDQELVLPNDIVFDFPPPARSDLGGFLVDRGQTIDIAVLQSLTGDFEAAGLDQLRATQLAIEDFGLIDGHEPNLGAVEDDGCSADGGSEAAQAIAQSANVLGVIGTTCSASGASASQVISQAGGVMISGSNTSSVLTSALQGNANEGWNPGFYRTSHNEVLEGTAAARFAFENLSASTAAVIVGGDPQSEGVGASFANSFQELGGEVTAFTRFAPTDTDMTPLLTELAASQPEVVYLSGPPSGGAFVAQQFASVPGLEATELIASQGLLVGDYLSVPQTQGTYLSGPSLDLGTNSRTNVSFADLNDRYEETFGEPPTTAFSAHSYDATVLLLAAIEAVALEGPGGAQWVDRQQLRDQLNATAGFTGMTGSIACDEFGDCGSQAIAVYRHEDSSASDLIASVNIVAQFNPDDGLG